MDDDEDFYDQSINDSSNSSNGMSSYDAKESQDEYQSQQSFNQERMRM